MGSMKRMDLKVAIGLFEDMLISFIASKIKTLAIKVWFKL